jgi:hypothetical protein
MPILNRLLVFIGLTSLLAVPAFADDLASSFEDAVVRADAQEQAASSKDYFSNTLLPYFGKTYAPVFKSCFATVPKPDSGRFSFVAAIGSDGRLLRLYRDRETNIYLCMRITLEKDVFPLPPVSPFYLHVEMTFPDDEPTRPASKEKAPPLILEPNKYSYTFGLPVDWDYSFKQAQEIGVRLVLFPKGGSFDKSTSVIYVTEVNSLCGACCTGTVSLAIAKTIREARDDSPTLQVAATSPIKIKEGGEASVRILTGARDPRQAKEALAFIEHDEAIILAVLTTKDAKTWDEDYRVFQEVISGHRFFNCNTPGLATPCSR